MTVPDKGSDGYQDLDINHVDFPTFLQKHVRLSGPVDILLMDNEGAEVCVVPILTNEQRISPPFSSGTAGNVGMQRCMQLLEKKKQSHISKSTNLFLFEW